MTASNLAPTAASGAADSAAAASAGVRPLARRPRISPFPADRRQRGGPGRPDLVEIDREIERRRAQRRFDARLWRVWRGAAHGQRLPRRRRSRDQRLVVGNRRAEQRQLGAASGMPATLAAPVQGRRRCGRDRVRIGHAHRRRPDHRRVDQRQVVERVHRVRVARSGRSGTDCDAGELSEKSYPQLRQRSTCSNPR